MSPLELARLRRALAAKGLTPLPRCPQCDCQLRPRAFAPSGVCWSCERERAEASVYFDQLNQDTDWPVQPAPESPMFAHDDGRPFPEED